MKLAFLSPSVMSCADSPGGVHTVAAVDTRLTVSPRLRLRLFYPTAENAAPPYAPWFPPSNGFPDQTVSAILRYTQVPLLPLAAPFLSHLANSPIPARKGGKLKEGEWDLMLFSHGLGGSVGGYSNFCIEMASRGYVVAAMEHSDGSAFWTQCERGRVDYEHFNPTIHNFAQFRGGQLEKRREEMQAVEKAVRGGKMEGIEDVSQKLTQSMVLAGHSFGGGTVLSCKDDGWEGKVKARVCLDAWLEPLGESIKTVKVDGDVLFVDMALSNMRRSVDMRKWIRVGGKLAAVKVEGGMHNNASDFGMRVPKFIAENLRLSPKGGDPVSILKRQAEATAAFLGSDAEWAQYKQAINNGEEQVTWAELGGAEAFAGRQTK